VATWGPAQGPTACDRVPFDAGLATSIGEARADAPATLDVSLSFPQPGLLNPDGLASGHLRTARLTLPRGFSVNPSAAQGLTACADEQARVDDDSPATCPPSSKIGDVVATSPLLADQLEGAIYIGSQRSRNPESGDMFRLFIVLENPRLGLRVKLPGRIIAVEGTGQLITTFDGNPQLPISSIALSFKGGSRAPVATPRECGRYAASVQLTSWSGKTITRGSGLDVPCGDSQSFTPAMTAGVLGPVAGSSSPFVLRLARSDGQDYLSRLTLNLPRGLLARIADVTPCDDAVATAGECPAASRVGSATVASGVGVTPLVLPGDVYLTGPYLGAPLGLAVRVHAKAGPFDLGVVVVRQQVFVDRDDAHLTVVSQPFPSIVAGVPLRLRDIRIAIDRPKFMRNPSACLRSAIVADVGSLGGNVSRLQVPFATTNCGALPFAPKIALKVGAARKLKRGQRTPLDVTLTMRNGEANNKSVQVTLPKVINARLDVVNRRAACSIEQFRADRCPTSVGVGTAVTPLLRDPLRGPAYFVYNPSRRLPDLVVRLKGQISFDLVGKVAITRDLRLRTTFDSVPDAQISRFRLRLESGRRNGPVGLTRDLCLPSTRRGLKAALSFRAQNGKTVSRSQAIAVTGCSRAVARGVEKRRRG
jgi:hypothetical protein